MLSEEAKKARREYHRNYYKTHKEQHKATMARYWERKALGEDAVSKLKCGKKANNNDMEETE